MKNWKTTLSAIGLAVLTGLYAAGLIETEVYLPIYALGTSLGLWAAQDANRTRI